MKELLSDGRLLGQQLWCSVCLKKIPPTIRPSDCLVLLREGHYTMIPGTAEIDQRLIGVCESCLEGKNDFQKASAQPVDRDHKDLIYKDN
jgi:hypothetical protein